MSTSPLSIDVYVAPDVALPGRTPNLARSATISGRRAASPSVSCFSEHDSGARKRPDSQRVAAFPENPLCRIGNAEQQTNGEVHMSMARISMRSSSSCAGSTRPPAAMTRPHTASSPDSSNSGSPPRFSPRAASNLPPLK